MLDLFTIFTQGGLVLWSFQGPTLIAGDPINGFIQDVLAEGRGSSADSYTVQNHAIKYRIDAANNLVFAVRSSMRARVCVCVCVCVCVRVRAQRKWELTSSP